MHLSAACSVGKWPRALTALRMREFRLSMLIWSAVIKEGCDLAVCVVDGVVDAVVVHGEPLVSTVGLSPNCDVFGLVGGPVSIVVAVLADGAGELAA